MFFLQWHVQIFHVYCGDDTDVCCILPKHMENYFFMFFYILAGQSVVAPMETGFSSLHEVFALWASPSVTFEPLNVTAFTRSSLAQAMSLALDDEVLSIHHVHVE